VKTLDWHDAHGRLPTVLVVEDEDDVRQSALVALEQFGCQAIEARNSAEALALLEGRRDVDLLFTDVRMPGEMNGVELAFTVRSRWPAIAIIIVSGFFDLNGSSMPTGTSFLAKPYRFAELKALIDQQLARSPQRGGRGDPHFSSSSQSFVGRL
jgi:DNA-binding NtrC family response regulator